MNRRAPPSTASAWETEVQIRADSVTLNGSLTLPADATGIVVFAHGSGSSRFSSRNRRVAQHLQSAGFGTLLFDLLTKAEEREDAPTGHLRFDITFLAERLRHASHWLRAEERTAGFTLGYFGASTGAAAALVAAALEPAGVKAVVSRGGRPDLAGEHLAQVRAPTLLIVGSDDTPVIPLNQKALAQLRCIKRLEIVPSASHLFEEAGTLDTVARLAAAWFGMHLDTDDERASEGLHP